MAGPTAFAVDLGFTASETHRFEATWLEYLLGVDLNPSSYALVVGVSNYEHEGEFRDLPTEGDPIAVKDFLMDVAGFDYVHLLTEADVTEPRLKEIVLRDFRSRVGPQDRLMIYWSGHGLNKAVATGGETGFLALSASRSDDLSSMIEMNALRRWTDFVPAEQLLFVIDACFSGFAGIDHMAGEPRAVDLERLRRPSRQLITAGTEAQQTFATHQPRGGGFTRAFLDGISGGADAANSIATKDGIVTVEELMVYLPDRMNLEIAQLRRQGIGLDGDLFGPSFEVDPQLYKTTSSQGTFYFVTPDLRDEARRYGSAVSAETAPGAVGMGDGSAISSGFDRRVIIATQARLRALGFVVGENGELDRDTEDALRAFQFLAQIAPTGRPDQNTQAALIQMTNRPPTDMAALRHPDLDVRIIFQSGAESVVDAVTQRLRSAGVRVTTAESYSLPGTLSGRLYFGDEWAGAARSLRQLTEGTIDLRLTPSGAAGDTMRIMIGLEAVTDN